MMRPIINNLILSLSRVTRDVNPLSVSTRFLTSSSALHDGQLASVSASEPTPSAPLLGPLLDTHGRVHDYLRISLTERCNLRCQYCMPAEGVPLSPRAALLSREELSRLVSVLAALGVRKIRLTGGEPTLRADLADIIQELSSTPGIESVSMTTNGLVLTRKLPALQRAGLAALNISLDTLKPDRYEKMSRRPGLSRVLAGIDLAIQLGYRPLKVNAVLMKGFNDDEICDFVEMTRERDIEIRFIEYMPFSGNRWSAGGVISERQALRVAAARYELTPAGTQGTARLWAASGHAGKLGFISSMTHPFCSTCNRLRITADGNLKVCLFGEAEVSLRDAIRGGASDQELADLIRGALRNKKAQHADGKPAHDSNRRVAAWTLPALRASGALYTPELYKTQATTVRFYSTKGPKLTHIDSRGQARVVDVSHKPETIRTAKAICQVLISKELTAMLLDGNVPKGDALAVARVAGVLGAKNTATAIPLCHPLPLTSVEVNVDVEDGSVRVECVARCVGRTGVEMEALSGAAAAALALYDTCKAVDRRMRITDLRVVEKTGGKHDFCESEQ